MQKDITNKEITVDDVNAALSILSKSSLGKMILAKSQNLNFDVSEIVILPSDGKRAGKCFRQMLDGEKYKDLVSVTDNFLNSPPFNEINTNELKHEMLANLIAHEFTHAAQYGHEPALMRIEKTSEQNEQETVQDYNTAAVFESVIEADCKAVQFMMAVSCNQPDEILEALKKIHIPSKLGHPEVTSLLDEKHFDKCIENFRNKPDIAKEQEAFREIFKNILNSYVRAIEKDIFPKKGITQKIDFNGCEKLIAGVYDADKYGSATQFADLIPGLTDENKAALVGKILLQRSSQKTLPQQHPIQVSSFRTAPATNEISPKGLVNKASYSIGS